MLFVTQKMTKLLVMCRILWYNKFGIVLLNSRMDTKIKNTEAAYETLCNIS